MSAPDHVAVVVVQLEESGYDLCAQGDVVVAAGGGVTLVPLIVQVGNLLGCQGDYRRVLIAFGSGPHRHGGTVINGEVISIELILAFAYAVVNLGVGPAFHTALVAIQIDRPFVVLAVIVFGRNHWRVQRLLHTVDLDVAHSRHASFVFCVCKEHTHARGGNRNTAVFGAAPCGVADYRLCVRRSSGVIECAAGCIFIQHVCSVGTLNLGQVEIRSFRRECPPHGNLHHTQIRSHLEHHGAVFCYVANVILPWFTFFVRRVPCIQLQATDGCNTGRCVG